MRKIHPFSIQPQIPERLAGLQELALNLRWSWNRVAINVFRHLDAELLEKSGGNPLLLLRRLSTERLEAAAADPAFVSHVDSAVEDLRKYMSEPGWFQQSHPDLSDVRVAYFCMEYGLTSCLPIYSGGLGVLAGDHLKSASDLNLPLVAIGLLYQKGYFIQRLDQDGWQQESYRMLDVGSLPIKPLMAGQPDTPEAGMPLKIHVDIRGRQVWANVWLAQVGRVPLYLLSTSLAENEPEVRAITSELYGGGPEERLAQELLLGIGGMKVLKALGIRPQVCHMNEGHTVFAGLERIRGLMKGQGLSFLEARQAAGAGNLFTTHTPVPAGFDLFPRALVENDMGDYLRSMGIGVSEFMRMGKTNDEGPDEFNVAVMALRQSPRRNAVSRLHRRVTAEMMQSGWPDLPKSEMPIESVTNGVHTLSWLASEMALLYDTYLGPRWRADASSADTWSRVERIPRLELWRTHTRLRERLIAYAREQASQQLRGRTGVAAPSHLATPSLSPEALTIGFARRFATYKRATLIMSDLDRLKNILLDETRPVQLVMAGKAHPRDGAGKDYIREIIDVVRHEGLSHRIVFVEDYDLSKAAILVQGVDVWLNTPRRPYEACGTSGMKVVPNGGLNLSILDGWWAEGYRPGVGWAIGNGQECANHEYQDQMDAESLYSLLEREVVPLFYDRDSAGLPVGWVDMMKKSIRILTPVLSGDRMVKQYTDKFYVPAAAHFERLMADDFAEARELTAWKARVRAAWSQVRVSWVEERGMAEVVVGEEVPVVAKVRLGILEPTEVAVQAFHSRLRPDGLLSEGRAVDLEWVGSEDGEHVYRGMLPARGAGLHAFSVRIMPQHEDVLIPNELPVVTWEQS